MFKRTKFFFIFVILVSISGCSHYAELSKLNFDNLLNIFSNDQPNVEQIAQKKMKENIENKRQLIKKTFYNSKAVYLEGETIKNERAWLKVPQGWYAILPHSDTEDDATIILNSDSVIYMSVVIDTFKPNATSKSDASPNNMCRRMLDMYANDSEKWSILEAPYRMTGFGESVCYFNVYRKPSHEFQYNTFIFMNSDTIYTISVSSRDGNFYPTLILNEALSSCFSSELIRAVNFALKTAPELKEFKKIDYKTSLFK